MLENKCLKNQLNATRVKYSTLETKQSQTCVRNQYKVQTSGHHMVKIKNGQFHLQKLIMELNGQSPD